MEQPTDDIAHEPEREKTCKRPVLGSPTRGSPCEGHRDTRQRIKKRSHVPFETYASE